MKEYALYRGDKFIDIGTAKQLAEKHNTTTGTIWWCAKSNRWKNKQHNRGMVVISIDNKEVEER